MFYHLKSILKDTYAYREVFVNLLFQDLKVKYRRTFFGYLWSLLNPILQISVLSFVFSHLVRWEVKNYSLYLFSGLLAYLFISTSVVLSARSYIDNENFIKKIYLPKLIFPMAKVCLRLVDFVFALTALLLIGVIARFELHPTVLLFPIVLGPIFCFTLGISMAVAVAQVFFRDVEYLLNVFMQILYFATPILYPVSVFPEKYRIWLTLNPVYMVIRPFQDLIYGGSLPNLDVWLHAWGAGLVALALGLMTVMQFEDELVYRM